jgi:hypothetical protein
MTGAEGAVAPILGWPRTRAGRVCGLPRVRAERREHDRA